MKKIENYQNKWTNELVNIEDLLLNPGNIRLELTGNNNQEAIINDLFRNEKVFEIVESIVDNGFLPDELPVITKENKKSIVIEGNRRIAALKSLINPDIAPQPYPEKIKKIMADRSPITTINVLIAHDKDEINKFLAIKHTKDTRRSWSPLRRAYFYYAQKTNGISIKELLNQYKGVDIPSYIKMYEMHRIALSLTDLSDDLKKKISNTGSFKITTLERLYDDKYAQEKLGISFNKETGEVSIPKSKDFERVYTQIITDIENNIATSRKLLDTDDHRKKYIDSIINNNTETGIINKTKITQVSSLKPIKPLKRTGQNKLAPLSMIDITETPGITRILIELQTIDYERFANATSDLLRTFLECLLKKYFDLVHNPVPTNGKPYSFLKDALLHAKEKYEADSNKRMIGVVGVLINQEQDFLNGINHNPDIFAKPKDVKGTWDRIEPLAKDLFEDYNNYKQVNK